MKKLMLLLVMAISIVSCSENIRTTPSGQLNAAFESDVTVTRCKRLDNGSISYVYLDATDRKVYRPRDTVFMTPNHYILDSINGAMVKIVLYTPSANSTHRVPINSFLNLAKGKPYEVIQHQLSLVEGR